MNEYFVIDPSKEEHRFFAFLKSYVSKDKGRLGMQVINKVADNTYWATNGKVIVRAQSNSHLGKIDNGTWMIKESNSKYIHLNKESWTYPDVSSIWNIPMELAPNGAAIFNPEYIAPAAKYFQTMVLHSQGENKNLRLLLLDPMAMPSGNYAMIIMPKRLRGHLYMLFRKCFEVSYELPPVFDYTHDIDHGWLVVSIKDLDYLGISNLISSKSRMLDDIVYLDEDEDLKIFNVAFDQKFPDKTLSYTHSYKLESKIRLYKPYEVNACL